MNFFAYRHDKNTRACPDHYKDRRIKHTSLFFMTSPLPIVYQFLLRPVQMPKIKLHDSVANVFIFSHKKPQQDVLFSLSLTNKSI